MVKAPNLIELRPRSNTGPICLLDAECGDKTGCKREGCIWLSRNSGVGVCMVVACKQHNDYPSDEGKHT